MMCYSQELRIAIPNASWSVPEAINQVKSTLFNGLTFIKKYGRIKTTN